MLIVIRQSLQLGEPGLAIGHWLEVLELEPWVQVDPALLVRLADALKEDKRLEPALLTLRMAMLAAGSQIQPVLALKVARVARSLDPNLARAAARMVLAHGSSVAPSGPPRNLTVPNSA